MTVNRKRGSLGETWWATRWTSVLESFGWSSRLQRGRSYARSGHVLSYEVTPGLIQARVQGSRARPYTVRIRLKPLADLSWKRVAGVMAGRASFAAQLLAGEMPQDIEEAFSAAGTALFPKAERDLETSCTCPDWANPCKHVAAVAYVVAEAFDRDPFLLFQLRGRSPQQILEELQDLRAESAAADEQRRGGSEEGGPGAGEDGRRGSSEEGRPGAGAIESGDGARDLFDPVRFWNGDASTLRLPLKVNRPQVSGLPLKRLGPPPALVQGEDLVPYFLQVYEAATEHALALAVGYDDEVLGP